MSAPEHPLLEALRKAQYDLTSAKAWLSEVERQVAALELAPAPRFVCGCGLVFRSEARLDEHLYHAHLGAEPPAWTRAEAYAAPPEPPST